MLIKPFLIVMLTCCKYDSSVINLTYSEQLQFSHIMIQRAKTSFNVWNVNDEEKRFCNLDTRYLCQNNNKPTMPPKVGWKYIKFRNQYQFFLFISPPRIQNTQATILFVVDLPTLFCKLGHFMAVGRCFESNETT